MHWCNWLYELLEEDSGCGTVNERNIDNGKYKRYNFRWGNFDFGTGNEIYFFGNYKAREGYCDFTDGKQEHKRVLKRDKRGFEIYQEQNGGFMKNVLSRLT